MAVTYSLAAINARLQGVADTIDGGGGPGNLVLSAGGTTVVSITLAVPCGVVSVGVLTFSGTLQELATGTGNVDTCIITDFTGATVVSGLTVGIPFSGADVIIANILNSTLITVGQVVQVTSATITGS